MNIPSPTPHFSSWCRPKGRGGSLLLAACLMSGLTIIRTTAAEKPALPAYGAEEFVPTPERCLTSRGDGSGVYPGSKIPAGLVVAEATGKGIIWKTELPQWGQSPPVVVKDRVYVHCESDTMVCLDAKSGKIIAQDTLGLTKPEAAKVATNGKRNYLSYTSGEGYPSPCTDGEAIYKSCLIDENADPGGNTGSLVAYDLNLKRLWRIRGIPKLEVKSGKLPWDKEIAGYGQKAEEGGWAWNVLPNGLCSMLVNGKLLIFSSTKEGQLVALDRKTGARVWGPVPGTEQDGYDTNPLLTTIGGRRVIVLCTGVVVDPDTGKILGDAMPPQKPKEPLGKVFSNSKTPAATEETWELLGSTQHWFSNAPIPTDREGVVIFGKLLWCCWDREGKLLSASAPLPAKGQNGAYGYRALPVRISFDAEGKFVSQPLWPEPVSVKYAEQGQHITYYNGHIFIVGPTLGRTRVVELETGKVVHEVDMVDAKTIPGKPDLTDPKEIAAMARFGLDEKALFHSTQGMFRMKKEAYARTFVDGQGRLWISSRFGELSTLEAKAPWTLTKVGAVEHPKVWQSNANLVPHGDRLYYRTFSHVYCLGMTK